MFYLLPASLVAVWLVLRLGRRGQLNIRLAASIGGFPVFALALGSGVSAGVSVGGSIFVGALAWAMASALLIAFLLVWRSRGGAIDGRPLRW